MDVKSLHIFVKGVETCAVHGKTHAWVKKRHTKKRLVSMSYRPNHPHKYRFSCFLQRKEIFKMFADTLGTFLIPHTLPFWRCVVCNWNNISTITAVKKVIFSNCGLNTTSLMWESWNLVLRWNHWSFNNSTLIVS